jgi:PTH1 family peptidyl-tRNA hydrolase
VKLIVGLGNPGAEYQWTPHNLGFLTVDRIADRCGVEVRNRHCRAVTARATFGGQDVLLAKPETFMNLSGAAVRELLIKHEAVPADLIVLYDELDLPLGTLRIKERGGAAGHNGMISVIQAAGTNEVLRVRMGIHPGHKLSSGADYVLTPFRRSQMDDLGEWLDTAADAVESILHDGVAAAMNRFHRKAEDASE